MREAFQYLSPEDCARLRPTVDAAALERFLASIPGTVRRMALLTFVRERTAEDLRLLNSELGDAESLADLEGLLAEPAPPTSGPHPVLPGSLPYVPVQSTSFVVQMEAPEDPKLLALWRPIEAGFTDRERRAGGAV
jgi:hypothetical protein